MTRPTLNTLDVRLGAVEDHLELRTPTCATCGCETTEADRPSAASDPWLCDDCLRATVVPWTPTTQKKPIDWWALVPTAVREVAA